MIGGDGSILSPLRVNLNLVGDCGLARYNEHGASIRTKMEKFLRECLDFYGVFKITEGGWKLGEQQSGKDASWLLVV